MGKKVITNKDFYKRFIECLKIGVSFGLEGKIVEGDIDIKEIYERIKEYNENNEEKLKGATIKEKENKIIININIIIHLNYTKFEGEVKFTHPFYKGYHIEGEVISVSFKKDVSLWNTTFKKDAIFRNAIFNGKADFSNATFEEEAYFNHAIFGENVDFSDNTKFIGNAYFYNATFEGSADFYNATFEEEAYFSHITFKKWAHFEKTTFNGKVYFSSATFNKEVSFERVIFEDDVYFMRTNFVGEVNFIVTIFDKKVNFVEAIFDKKADFGGTDFGRPILDMEFDFEIYADFSKVNFKDNVDFNYAKFNYAKFNYTAFNGEANFSEVIFNSAEFNHTIFEKNVDFSECIFNKAKFSESTFKSRAYFDDIIFNLLSFVKCRFRDTTSFKKDVLNNEKIKRLKNRLENDEIMAIYEYENLAMFNFVVFDENTTIDNFPLSKTSFLRTDVRKIMLMEYIEKEGILSYNLLINKNKYGGHNDNKDIYDEAYNILKPYLKNHISVLAECRNLRLSVEDNITYEEASNLYKMEMELRRKYSKFPEDLAIWLYGLISDYGESVEKSVLWIILTIALLPPIALLCNYYILSCCILVEIIILFRILYVCTPQLRSGYLKIHNKVSNIISKIPYGFYFLLLIISPVVFIYTLYIYPPYGELLRDTITAFFQLSIDDEHFMKNWEGIIRITSLILLGNLYIALRRRLSRK